jgi:hypothetical protein
MEISGEKLASSLKILYKIQRNRDTVAIKSSQIPRVHKERLIKHGFLRRVLKGWYIATNPIEKKGDSTSWNNSFWKFCAQFLKAKFKNNYSISAEQSLLIHAGKTTIPNQLIVRADKATNTKLDLLFKMSIFVMKSSIKNKAYILKKNDLQMYSLHASLIYCTPTMFIQNPIEMRTVLSLITEPSELLKLLLEGSHSVVAGRLAGAFRNIGQDRIADEIVNTMKSADFVIREKDPFKTKTEIKLAFRNPSPYVNRIKLMWNNYRKVIIKNFPKELGLPKNKEKYLNFIEKIYTTDAYHSLSIERYIVSLELIEKVQSGKWDLLNNEDDKNYKNAMAARGYWQASQEVKESIKTIINGKNAGKIADLDHGKWFRELFAPSVVAGILKPSDLAGYRTNQVYISNSRHVPLNKEAIRDAMPTFFELLAEEKNAGVRVVLGHFIFVYIHPYMDGNGRIARFLMNVMLASGGYPWTVIPVEKRTIYMNVLEKASVDSNILPFTKFISNLVKMSIQGKPLAKI